MRRSVRQEVIFGICLAVSAVIAFSAARFATAARVAHVQATVAPFSLETDIYKVSSSGLELKKIHKKARKSDGTTAEMDSVGKLDWGLFARKVTTLDGEAHGIMDALQMVSSYRTRQNELELLRYRLRTPPAGCVFETMQHVKEEKYGDIVLDVNVEYPGNGLRATDRLASKLGCEVIASDLDKLIDGVYIPVTEEHIVSLSIGDPNEDLFAPWSLYRESRFSDMKSAALQSRGVAETPRCSTCYSGLKRLDERHENYMKQTEGASTK